MKNQLDLIVSLSTLVIALVFAGYFYSTARKPAPPAPVVPIVLTPVKMPSVNIEMVNGISAGKGRQPAIGGGGAGGATARGGR